MSLRSYAIVACTLVVACGSATAQKKHHAHPAQEQLAFSADDQAVKEPVAIPDTVKPILAKDDYVQRLLEDKRLTPDKLPAAWFSAALVRLTGQRQNDLVVVGEGPIRGADGTTFWIFCPTPHGYAQALKISAHTLVVKDLKTKGAREMEAQSPSAGDVFSVSYRFDGQQYRSYKEVSEPIK
jgi:hypothetical protein